MECFKDEIISETEKIRTFYFQDNFMDYKWHYDLEDRLVKVLEIEGDWKFQWDNELPISLSKNMELSIKKSIWHRLIPKSSAKLLKIKIILWS